MFQIIVLLMHCRCCCTKCRSKSDSVCNRCEFVGWETSRSVVRASAAVRTVGSYQRCHCCRLVGRRQPGGQCIVGQNGQHIRCRDRCIGELVNRFCHTFSSLVLVVRHKVGRPPSELGVSNSMECDIFPSVLRHCWLGDRKGIRPVKTGCWFVGGDDLTGALHDL